MSKFIAKLNKLKKYTLEDICKIHCEFEIIHPFLDGNGRIGRILMLRMCLLSNVYPFIINHETREEYLSCIKMYRKTKSSGFLVEYCHKLQIIFIQKFNKFLKDIHVTKIMN
jgi:Fic family protein